MHSFSAPAMHRAITDVVDTAVSRAQRADPVLPNTGGPAGNRAYRQAGPPPLLLRLLGPVVVLTTLAVLATGLVLIAVGPDATSTTLLAVAGQQVSWLTLHQGTFIVWGGTPPACMYWPAGPRSPWITARSALVSIAAQLLFLGSTAIIVHQKC